MVTYEEAKRIINNDVVTYEELQEARRIATECIEKQIPKKPQNIICEIFKEKVFVCQNCKRAVLEVDENGETQYGKKSYCCERCGQALDWSDYE